MFQFKRVAGMIAIHALMLLGAATAWAGRGDVDPNYGEGGALAIGAEVLVDMPNDRLAIIAGSSVSVADSNGRAVTSFGDDGQAVVPTPADTPRFQAWGAAAGPDGHLLVYGELADMEYTQRYEAMFLLDATGRADSAFGGHDDGFLRLAGESAAAPAPATLDSFARDSAGRIVLIERFVNPDGVCEAPARIRRLLPNGELDESFGTGGAAELANLDPCAPGSIVGVRADGSVVVGSGPDIFSFDAAGGIDVAFGADGRLTVTELTWVRGLLLPDGGLLIFGSSDDAASSNDTVLLKFGRNGQPDLDFGPGTGSVTVDLGTELLGEPFAREHVDQLTLDPDGEHMVAQLSVSRANESLVCGGIARMSIDGTPDTGFGRDGVTCLNFSFALIAVQSNGAPLFGHGGAIYRLLPDNRPSPGFLREVGGHMVGESQGTATVAIERFAGRDGAVSVNYATVNRQPVRRYPYALDSATAGSDYEAESGRLDWSNGDDGQRTVTVRIRDDRIDEIREWFGVSFSGTGGGAQLIAGVTSVVIDDDDAASSMSPPPASGGGGPVTWAPLLALLILLLTRHRQVRRVAGMIAIHASMLLAPVAIAGSGDLDPAYADVGRLGPIAGLEGPAWSLELLQDGSSLVSGSDVVCRGSYHSPVRGCVATNFVDRVDAAGALDKSWNAGTPERIEVRDAALQPDGKLLAVGRTVGSLFRFVAFRLASDGSLDSGFGSAGIVELPIENYPGSHLATSVALEPDGRIVIAGFMDGDMFVLRLLADGGFDNTFGNAGVYHDPAALHGVALRVVRSAGGGYRILTTGGRCRVIAFTSAGAIDGAYGASGIANLEWSPEDQDACGTLASQADGRLLVAGSTGTAGVAIRLLESGAPDPSFAADARVASVLTRVTAVAAGANGTILIGGIGSRGAEIMRLKADGALDAQFGNRGVTGLDLPSEGGSQPVIQDLVAGPDGEVLAAGGEHFSDSPFVIRLLGDAGGESAGVLGVSQPFIEASEEDLEAVVNVRRTGGSDGSVSVAYQTAAGSATANEDFQSVTGVLTWADGDSGEKQIVVPIAIAGNPEEHEDFRVTLHDVQGGAGLGTRSGAVTILPDGSPAGQFAIDNGYQANESDTIEVWVYRNFYSSGEVSVTVTPTSGTAVVGEDLEAQPVVLTWSDQDYGEKRVAVRILNDSDKEEAESFTMVLSNATGGAAIGPYSAATYSIARNDFAVAADAGANRGGGGASTWATLLALLTILFMRRRLAFHRSTIAAVERAELARTMKRGPAIGSLFRCNWRARKDCSRASPAR